MRLDLRLLQLVRRPRVIGTTLILLLASTAAWAYLPLNIENVIKSWFDGASNVAVRFTARSAPSGLPANACDLYFDRTSGVLTANCKNSSGTGFSSVVVGSGCAADASGNLACNSFISANQNLLASPAINRLRIFDNTVNLTPDPRCADYGQSGVLTVLDSDEASGTAVYTICAGAVLADTLNATGRVLLPFGAESGTGVTNPAADDACKCYLFDNPLARAAVDNINLDVTTGDANDTLKVGIYNYTGTRQYYEAAVDLVAAAGIRKTANALRICVGGTNQDVGCTNSTECPGGSCPAQTSPPMPRGAYWLCFGQNVVTASAVVLGNGFNNAQVYGATFSSANGCVAGDLPNTLAITPTFGTGNFPYIAITDE